MKSILITHGNCPDGAAAVVLAKKVFPDTKVVFGIHNKINEQIKKAALDLEISGNLWITDICCDQDVLIECQKILRKKEGTLGVYEHHQTRRWLQSLNPIADFELECVYDEGRCGSKIFYDVLVEKGHDLSVYQDFIEATNDRDLWLNQNPQGETLAELHEVLGDEKYIQRFIKNPQVEFTPTEDILLNHLRGKKKAKINKLLEKIEIKRDEMGFDYGVMFGEAPSSDLLNEAIRRFNLEYALLVNLNTRRASIRGRGNMDCADYAQKRGGGGHRCASGFRVNFQMPNL